MDRRQLAAVKSCDHLKEDGKPCVGGQTFHDGVARYICLRCHTVWASDELPAHLRPGSPVGGDFEILPVSKEDLRLWMMEQKEIIYELRLDYDRWLRDWNQKLDERRKRFEDDILDAESWLLRYERAYGLDRR